MRPALVLVSLVLAAAAVGCSSDSSSSGGILSGKSASSASSSPAAGQGQPASGASSSDKAPQPTAKPASNVSLDPCQILTKDDAAAALGKPVADGKATASDNPLGQKLCFYAAAGAADPASIQLSLITTGGLSEPMKKNNWSAKQQFTSEKNLSAATPVTGLGEDAFIRGPLLTMLKGDTDAGVLILGLTSGSPEHTNALKLAAARVLPRLP